MYGASLTKSGLQILRRPEPECVQLFADDRPVGDGIRRRWDLDLVVDEIGREPVGRLDQACSEGKRRDDQQEQRDHDQQHRGKLRAPA